MNLSNDNQKLNLVKAKVFSRWVSNKLINGTADGHIIDISKDLSDGVSLIKLANILTKKENPQILFQSPTKTAEKVQNCDLAIEIFINDGVYLNNISGKDINNNEEKPILALIWSLIQQYSIKQSININSIEKVSLSKISNHELENKYKSLLMTWAITRTANYPGIANFNPLELAMCALLDSFAPNKANFFSLDPKNSKHNASHATKIMKNLGIAVYLDPEDYLGKVDDQIILTQLAEIKIQLENNSIQKPPIQQLANKFKFEDLSQLNSNTHHSNLNKGQSNSYKDQLNLSKDQSNSSNDQSNLINSQSNSSNDQSNLINSQSNSSNDQSNFDDQSSELKKETKTLSDAFSSQSKPESISDENSNQSNKEIIADEIVNDVDYYESEYEEEEDKFDSQHTIKQQFLPACIKDDNKQFAGKKFALLMDLNEFDYNHGKLYKANKKPHHSGKTLTFALTLSNERNAFLNPSGLRLDITKPNIEHDVYQQFTFGKGEWSTVIDSFARKGMVWDVADNENLNPPVGTQFYLFPFHGRHNQHFVLKNDKIYAKQNGMVVTYVGGDEPLVMMPQSSSLKCRQTFKIQFI